MLVGRFEIWKVRSRTIRTRHHANKVGEFYGGFHYAVQLETAANKVRRMPGAEIYKIDLVPASVTAVAEGQKLLFFR
jgi:hypothetical protein